MWTWLKFFKRKPRDKTIKIPNEVLVDIAEAKRRLEHIEQTIRLLEEEQEVIERNKRRERLDPC